MRKDFKAINKNICDLWGLSKNINFSVVMKAAGNNKKCFVNDECLSVKLD